MSGSLYVVAGEMSGDAHAAGLLRALLARKPELRVAGAGGPKMRAAAGEGIRDWIDQAAVMGLVEVLRHYPWFKARFTEMLAEIRELKPEVLLLIDYPGFNFRFAAAVREALPETRIVQYVCPQVWAWKKGRIPKMVELFDELLCLLPFEPEIFRDTPLKATFVGHPLVDELEEERVAVSRERDLVALLPGSREREVAMLFPVMLDTAARLLESRPGLRFEVAAANERLRGEIRAMVVERGLDGQLDLRLGGAHELMQRATCGLVASGTATLEAGYYGMPYCLLYKLAWPTYLVARMVVKIEHAGLVNILAGEEVVQEFIQSDADPCQLEPAIGDFLDNPEHATELSRQLKATTDKLGGPGAHERAAERVAAYFFDV